MPRGRCHFAMLLALQDRLCEDLPIIGALAQRHFSDFLAGSLAPDAMRSLGKLGKYRSHFYSEDRPDTWGKSVSGMFEVHPSLANPAHLSERDCAFIMGYVSHLTTDEAFRDAVTIYVHGTENWRPIIRGLWSLVDELSVNHPDLGKEIDGFDRSGLLGFIDFDLCRQFLHQARGWAVETDPWKHEQVFLEMIGKDAVKNNAHAIFLENRRLAIPFLSDARRACFVADAVDRGFGEIQKFTSGTYVRDVL
jgi:hypothetical protein